MKPHYEEMQDLLCLYENHDVVTYLMKNGEADRDLIKTRDLTQCFAKRNIPTKYMECMLNSNIYYYWNEQIVPGKPPMRAEYIGYKYIQSANGTLNNTNKLTTYECNVRYHNLKANRSDVEGLK